MVGGDGTVRPAWSSGGPATPSIWRIHVREGRRGARFNTMPGAFTSTPMMPVFTSTRSHSSTPGSASGVPLPSGSLILMSPTRNSVCVHELPCAPRCAGELGYIPPPSMRFDTTSGWMVSRSE